MYCLYEAKMTNFMSIPHIYDDEYRTIPYNTSITILERAAYTLHFKIIHIEVHIEVYTFDHLLGLCESYVVD